MLASSLRALILDKTPHDVQDLPVAPPHVFTLKSSRVFGYASNCFSLFSVSISHTPTARTVTPVPASDSLPVHRLGCYPIRIHRVCRSYGFRKFTASSKGLRLFLELWKAFRVGHPFILLSLNVFGS